MKASDVEALLHSFVLPTEGLTSEVGIRDGKAYLKVSPDSDPSEYAVVWTPGDRWFSLDVAGGYSYDYFEEDTPDVDVVELLGKLAQAATAYIEGRRSTTLSRFFKIPTVRVETDSGPVELWRVALVGTASPHSWYPCSGLLVLP